MKIKNFQIFDERHQNAINDLMQKDLVGVTALKVVKIARKLDEILTDINKSIQIIRDKYTIKNDDGSIIHPLDENGQPITNRVKISDNVAFNKELQEILSIENDLSSFEFISEKEIEKINISPKILISLQWMIK